MRHLLSVLLLLLLGIAPAVAAESALDLLDAPVGYSAAFSVTSRKGTYHGSVWHMPGRERREVATSGGGQGILIDRKADTASLLGIGGRWHVGLSLSAAAGLAGGLDAWQVRRERLREENVGAIRATRWKLRAEGPKGGFAGDVWISREGIVVRAQGLMTSTDGDDSPVEMILSELRVGPVEASRFQIPEGWFGFDLRKVPPERVVQAVESLKPLLEARKPAR